MFLATVVLVAALFLGSAASAGLKAVGTGETKQNNITSSISAIPSTTALAPHTAMPSIQPHSQTPRMDRGQFYAYDLYSYYTVTFETDAVLNNLAYAGIYFFSGGDMDLDGNWYVVGYYGGLYSIDKDTGIYTTIAPSTIYCDSLVFDTSTQTWYVSSGNMLYTMDITDGSTTLVGSFGTTNYVVSLMCDSAGNMYGYDVLFGGDSTLYSVDKSNGAATVVGDMGHNFCYAQEGKFDHTDGTLYLAAYDIGMGQSYLATCDPATAEVTIINQFAPTGIEIDGLGFYSWGPEPFYSVGVKKIIAPASGNASVITPKVTVKNDYWEDLDSVPVNMKIVKNKYTNYLNEHFDESTFPPAGWSNMSTTDYWVQSADNYSGGITPEAVLWYYNNFGGSGGLQSPYMDTSSATFLNLTFRSYIYWWGGPCMCKVEITGDGGITWNDMSPWVNPITASQGPKLYSINISTFIGTQTAVRFTYSGQSSWLYFWALDNVRIFTMDQIPEYNQTVYADIPAEMKVNVTFPDWTPADLGVSENITFEFIVSATTQLSGDWDPHDDYKQKTFTLAFGYFHDVAITAINSPVSGLAQTQPCQVVLENHGQDNETVDVNMVIGKASYSTLLTEDFSSGVPPTGWGTDDSLNWMSSNTNYAGGTAPEAMFYYLNSDAGDFHLYSDVIDTTGWTSALLKYKEYVNDCNSQYTLKVQTSTDGGIIWNDAYTRAGGPYGPTTTQVTLGTVNGIGSNNLMISWTFSGNSNNINYWYIDDVCFGQISTLTEYNQTVDVNINAGQAMNVDLPDWTPADMPFVTDIDYLISASASMNISDGYPVDNDLTKLITLRYEHDVGVTEITLPSNPPPSSLPPGYYPLEATIQNFGATYTESNIPIEARITHVDNDTIIYDQAMTVPGPLAPGEATSVFFPDFYFGNGSAWEGHYHVDVWTALPGDDHPENDKKSTHFDYIIPDYLPPITNHTLNGTMGLNGWYVSNVILTLSAYDPYPPVKDGPKPPSGVDHIYYKLHAGDNWTEYTAPVTASVDGIYELFYYSVDKAGNCETVKGPFPFKIDKTPPAITLTGLSENALKTKWLLNASVADAISGVAKVEFYVNDILLGNVSAPGPYLWHYEGKGKTAQAIVYDNAGNSAVSNLVQSTEFLFDTQPSIENQFLVVRQMLLQR